MTEASDAASSFNDPFLTQAWLHDRATIGTLEQQSMASEILRLRTSVANLRTSVADLEQRNTGLRKLRAESDATVQRTKAVLDAAEMTAVVLPGAGIPTVGGCIEDRVRRLVDQRDALLKANQGLAVEAKANPDVVAREGCFALLRAAGIGDAGTVSAGIEKLVAERDEARQDRAKLYQALGVLSTLAPSLEVDLIDPVSMAKRIEAVVRSRLGGAAMEPARGPSGEQGTWSRSAMERSAAKDGQSLDAIYEALLAVCNSHGKRPAESFVAFVERLAQERNHARTRAAMRQVRDEPLAGTGKGTQMPGGVLPSPDPKPDVPITESLQEVQPHYSDPARGGVVPNGVPYPRDLADSFVPIRRDENGRIGLDVPISQPTQELQTKPGGYTSVALPVSKPWPGANAVADRLEAIARGLTYNDSDREGAAKHWLFELAMLIRAGHTRRPDEQSRRRQIERMRREITDLNETLDAAVAAARRAFPDPQVLVIGSNLPALIDDLRGTIAKLRQRRDEWRRRAEAAERGGSVAEHLVDGHHAKHWRDQYELAKSLAGDLSRDCGKLSKDLSDARKACGSIAVVAKLIEDAARVIAPKAPAKAGANGAAAQEAGR